jgi:hypothetical protein
LRERSLPGTRSETNWLVLQFDEAVGMMRLTATPWISRSTPIFSATTK